MAAFIKIVMTANMIGGSMISGSMMSAGILPALMPAGFQPAGRPLFEAFHNPSRTPACFRITKIRYNKNYSFLYQRDQT